MLTFWVRTYCRRSFQTPSSMSAARRCSLQKMPSESASPHRSSTVRLALDDFIHVFRRHERPLLPRMALLPPAFPAALRLRRLAFDDRGRNAERRLRRIGRVSIQPRRQLGDLRFQLDDPGFCGRQLRFQLRIAKHQRTQQLNHCRRRPLQCLPRNCKLHTHASSCPQTQIRSSQARERTPRPPVKESRKITNRATSHSGRVRCLRYKSSCEEDGYLCPWSRSWTGGRTLREGGCHSNGK